MCKPTLVCVKQILRLQKPPRMPPLHSLKHPCCACAQTEKQRIIWAYKILFLDVLFPLSLRKVIFVDSDQIVRADFAELWNMDLKVHGALVCLNRQRMACIGSEGLACRLT